MTSRRSPLQSVLGWLRGDEADSSADYRPRHQAPGVDTDDSVEVAGRQPDPSQDAPVGLDGAVNEPILDGAAQDPTGAPAAEVDPDLVVDLRGVGVRRGSSVLLADVDWQVEVDERWILLGPNGAGKTTLLQLAAAQMHPTTGVVRVLGEELGKVDVFELRPRIGLASASLAGRISPGERARDVVVSAGYAVLGRWREEYEQVDLDRADELLKQWGVDRFSERTFGTLSEGERKRVMIARALMTDPELLLLDEPSAGLDLGGREDLVGRLGALAADPDAPALVMVTHHVEDIPRGFTNVLMLRDGRVTAQGYLDEQMTDESIRATFDVDVRLSRRRGRYFAASR